LAGINLDLLDVGECVDVVYAWLVDRLGREDADQMLNAPLPGTPEYEAEKQAKIAAGQKDLYSQFGVEL
jgi:hypothetical protein